MIRALSSLGPLVLAGAAAVEPSREAKAFGARELVEDISLSADGKKVAIVRADGGRGSQLVIADLATGETKGILASSGAPERITQCRWTGSTRLACTIYLVQPGTDGAPTALTRLVAISADGTGLKMLTPPANARDLYTARFGGEIIDWTGDGKEGSVLMMRRFVPRETTGTNIRSDREGNGVDAVDSLTLARTTVEQSRPNAGEFITDGRGKVRIMGTIARTPGGYMRDQMTYSYRKAGQRDWTTLGTLRLDRTHGSGFNPYAVDPDTDVVYGFDDLSGRRALYRVALDGTMKKELVLARPDVDVDGLIRIGRQGRVVGGSWVSDQRSVEFFDPELKRLSASLGKALPKSPIVRFVDASAGEKQLLLSAGSDDDPGRYYAFDKATRNLAEVLAVRPQLAGIPLGRMRHVTYRAADGTMIPGYLTLPAGSAGKGLRAIVMPHGGPGSRDEWGFDWLAQFFASRGYAVLQPNFRGSTGYGDAWFQKNGFQSWRTAVGDIVDGGKWLAAEGIAAPGKTAIVGWSYGGYAALQSTAIDPALFKAIVAIAPVTDLDMLRNETRDDAGYTLTDRFIGHGPHIQDGSPARNAKRIAAPVLLFHGTDDLNVGVGQSRLMADRLRDAGGRVEYAEFKGLDHQLADSAARTEMLDRSDRFLRAALGE